MVHSKFGSPDIAQVSMESFTTAVIEARLLPPSPPRRECWRDIMEELSSISCEAYRCAGHARARQRLPSTALAAYCTCSHFSKRVHGCADARATHTWHKRAHACRGVVFRNPDFVKYFRTCTPEGELGKMNIGSRPSRRKAADAGVGSLRAIPWIFAWTQTRHVLPSWLGVGEALEAAMPQHGDTLREMVADWPFFGSTLSLVEMTLAKADMNVANYYDKVSTSRMCGMHASGYAGTVHGVPAARKRG